MAAYVAGDPAAFEALFARHAPALLGMLMRHLRSRAEADDVLQQTFLQLHRARLDFRPGSELRPWLYTIAMNAMRERFRRASRKREAPLGPGDEDRLRTEGDPLEEQQEAARARTRLHAALQTLPANQREVIELHWFQGRPFTEIAAIVGSTLSAVKVRAHRGYERLRKTLAEGDDDVTSEPVPHKRGG